MRKARLPFCETNFNKRSERREPSNDDDKEDTDDKNTVRPMMKFVWGQSHKTCDYERDGVTRG